MSNEKAKGSGGFWWMILLLALVIEVTLCVVTYAGVMGFPQLIDSSIAMLLAIATTLLAWFTKQLASVNERLRSIEENREGRDRVKTEYESLKLKISVAEDLITQYAQHPTGLVDGLKGQSSLPQPETNLIESLRVLVNREKDNIPFSDLDKLAEILMNVKITRVSNVTIGGSTTTPYRDLTAALKLELPRWREQQIEMLSMLHA